MGNDFVVRYIQYPFHIIYVTASHKCNVLSVLCSSAANKSYFMFSDERDMT